MVTATTRYGDHRSTEGFPGGNYSWLVSPRHVICGLSKSPSSDMWFESLQTFLVVSSTHMYLVCVAVQSVDVDATSAVTERATDGND